jgi:quercetin dioxygenase-like cupin family protein
MLRHSFSRLKPYIAFIMAEKFNESTRNRPNGSRPLDAPILLMNLPDYVRQIKNEVAWQDSDRNAITLMHNDLLRIVLIALKPGAEMSRHAVEAAISIQVVSGRLWVETEDWSYSADEGDIIALQASIPHYVFAEEESVFLLTLSGNDRGEF